MGKAMWKFEAVMVAWAAVCAVTVGACAYPVEKEAPPAQTGGEQAQPTAPWPKEMLESPDGSVRLHQARMPVEEERFWRTQFQQTELLPLTVPAWHQASVFRIRNSGSLENSALIGPRIFAYRSSDGARLANRRNADGTVTLIFPVVLTDGLSAQIQSPTAGGLIRLPRELLVQDPAGLQASVSESLGRDVKLGVLPGCPRRILVRVANQEYDVTPSDLAAGDHCPLNVPFTAALTLSEGDARFLLESALYSGAVELRAVYETQVPFTVGRSALEIDKGRLLEELERAIALDGGVWLAEDLPAKIARVLRGRLAQLGYAGDLRAQVDRLVPRIADGFFAPLGVEERTARAECLAASCVQLSYVRSRQVDVVSVSWETSSTALTGQRYLTWTKLQPLQDRTVVIGETPGRYGCSETPEDEGMPCRPSLRNDGSSIETGLTVLPGDLLEVTPSFLVKEERDLEIARTTRSSNVVCVRRDLRTVTDCDSGGERGRCRERQHDMGCAETQDQWVERTTYAMDVPRMVRFDRPVGQIQEIFGGMVLRFTFRREGVERELECPMNAFAQEGDGQALRIRLEDRVGCRLFEEAGVGNSVMLHLKNAIHAPQTYRAGAMLKYWNGQTENQASVETYIPQVLFGGSVAIRGYSVGALELGGTKAP